MFSLFRRAAPVATLLLAAACADRQSPAEPSQARPDAAIGTQPSPPESGVEQARNERLARRFALALRDDAFRAVVYRSLRRSPEPEGKIHLQRFLGSDGGRGLQQLAQLSSNAEGNLTADLDPSPPIEIYLPVPEHRIKWRGTRDVLVATAIGDHDAPVAFDSWGRRHVLSADAPPTTPVIALGRAETSFGQRRLASDECPGCFIDPNGGGTTGGGSTGGPNPAPPASAGLYMTYAKYDGTFEGWLKGDPEFEVHILGQDGSSNAMRTYQCAGEKAGAPYQFDQNGTEWSGSVMLFSQAELNAYKAQHPGQAVRVFVVEDDDGTCVIKTDSARVERLFQQLVQTYGDLTGGKDTTLISVRTFKSAFSLLRLLRSTWSVITTSDDIVGTAIEDAVAGEFYPPANWVVKGDNTVTHGAVRLEMR